MLFLDGLTGFNSFVMFLFIQPFGQVFRWMMSKLCVSHPYVGMMSLSIFNCVRQYPYLGMIMSKLCFDWWTPFKKQFV